MATVHTAHGPGRIVEKETVRGRTQYKVAGDGFEVWLDEAKIASQFDGEEPEVSPPVSPGGWHDEHQYAPVLDEEFPPHPMVENHDLGRSFDRRRMDDFADPDDYELQRNAARQRRAWAPLDHENSTKLPYNPDPQHEAVGFSGDDGSATLQPIHHIDPDERLHSSDSLTFEDEEDEGGPGPNPDLFAKQADHSYITNHPWVRKPLDIVIGPKNTDFLVGTGQAATVNHVINKVDNQIDKAVDMISPGVGWGDLIQNRTGSYRPAGLSDRYIDITAEFDYHNDPVAQFRHDPDAYINRIGHLMDEGLNPRFAEYMELVEADRNIRTAAWKDVRKKALRLKREGHVTVKDMSPSSIMASVVGDHGTYDVTVLKGASLNGISSNQIANWHCACEWGRWAFRRKYTYVGRLCSHAYASYLTMQSAAMKGKERPRRRGPSDAIIVNRPAKDRALPTFVFAAGRRQADALQNGPDRLVPELVINDTDDAHTFLDVTKDEREDTGPDDVVSDKDIVHFARLMRHCEVTEQPYPRQLVAFLARYSGCSDDYSDDTQADYEAHDATDANEYLEKIRSDADRKQENDFGSMAERVHEIQDSVEEAHAHGADASRFVAAVRKMADGNQYTDTYDTINTKVPNPAQPGPGQPSGSMLWKTPDAWNPNLPRDSSGQPIPGSTPGKGKGQAVYDSNGVYQPPAGKGTRQLNTETTPSNAGDNIRADNEDDLQDSRSSLPADRTMNNPPMPGGKAGTGSGQQSNSPGSKGVATGQPAVAPTPGASNAGNPGTGGTPGAGGSGGAGRPMTQGPISDGGVAGAENGNNSAIGAGQLDAEGYYTVQKGDTLSDIAQRSYGDMNKYQDLAKGNNIANPDVINEGQRIKIDNPTGNGGMAGDVTNPGGSSKAMAGPAADTSAVAPPANPAMATPGDTGTAGSAGAGVPSSESLTSDSTLTNPGLNNPPAQAPLAAEAGGTSTPKVSRRRLSAPATPADPNAGQDGQTNTTAPTTTAPKPAAPASTSTTPTAQPGGTNSPKPVGPNKDSDTYDPDDPDQAQQPGTGRSDGSMMSGGGMTGMDSMDGLSQALGAGADIASGLGQAIPDIASGLGNALPGMASGIGDAVSGIASGLGSIFANRQDFDDWVRYAYPAGGGDDFNPKTLPHIPFAGSGNPGPLEYGTSEEYADRARAKADDVTDLGSGDLTKPMGDWQKQGAYDDDDHGNHHKSGSFDPNDDSSDIVRTFQAHIGETALGAGAGQGAGRFDDFSSAAQGFLRTAGRNYSLAEQSELIREGDKGGAGNLRSLDLTGTHYEDMDSLGW